MCLLASTRYSAAPSDTFPLLLLLLMMIIIIMLHQPMVLTCPLFGAHACAAPTKRKCYKINIILN